MRALASATLVLVAGALVAGCGGAAFGPEWTVAHARPAEPAAPALVLGSMVIADAGSSAPLLVLDADGTMHHADCPMRLSADGTVRADDGAMVLRVDDDAIVGAEGRSLYRFEGERLVRADGRAATIEGERIVFEESPELALRIEGADAPPLRRTALVLVAALAVCGG